MKIFQLVGAGIRKLTTLFGVISYVGFFGVMLMTVADVFMRYLFNAPIYGAYEMVQYLLMLGTFASFAYCESLHGHINITMLIRLFPPKLSFLSYALTGFGSAWVLFMIGQAAVEQAQMFDQLNYVTSMLRIKTAPFLWFEAITMFLFALMVLFHAIESVCAMFDQETADRLRSNWS